MCYSSGVAVSPLGGGGLDGVLYSFFGCVFGWVLFWLGSICVGGGGWFVVSFLLLVSSFTGSGFSNGQWIHLLPWFLITGWPSGHLADRG